MWFQSYLGITNGHSGQRMTTPSYERVVDAFPCEPHGERRILDLGLLSGGLHEVAHPREIVSHSREVEHPSDPQHPSIPRCGHQPDYLKPHANLLHPLALPLIAGVVCMAGGAASNGRSPLLTWHVRGDLQLPQLLNKLFTSSAEEKSENRS